MTEITRELARYVAGSELEAMPETVRGEAVRTLVNWVGCALGGCRTPAVEAALAALAEIAGPRQAVILGRGERIDMANAAFLNCLSSSVHAFDDTHLATVTHPTGPVAAACLALAGRQRVSGPEFLQALVLGMEIQCRMSNVLTAPPARCNLGFYMTGLTGGIGTAAAIGKLLELDEQHLVWALGIGAVQAAGFRETHATMCSGFVPAQAGRSGLVAALLAARGFTCSERSLEAPKGFTGVFAEPANLAAATDRLGQHFEMLANAYKPYPCGIVIHPAIDACLDLVRRDGVDAAAIERVELEVHPLALELTGRTEPKTGLDAQVSLYHWAAASLLHGAAGLGQAADDCVRDPAVIALRRCIVATSDPGLGRDEARGRLVLRDGSRRETHIRHSRGSLDRPLTDAELDEKFLAQAGTVLPAPRAAALLALCRGVAALPSVGHAFADFFAEDPGIENSTDLP